MNILIIDDDKLTSLALQRYLTEKGHNALIAKDGQEAIKRATAEKFDLIISDIMLPGLSGLSMINLLRSVHLCTIPIISMSSLSNQALLEAAFEAGANDFMSKPFTPDDLDNRLRKYSLITGEH